MCAPECKARARVCDLISGVSRSPRSRYDSERRRVVEDTESLDHLGYFKGKLKNRTIFSHAY